ncbi:MAG: hypothetical protein ACI9KE_001535 [Polyangiales bacterium]|jgi:hypothetical protein
MLSWRHVEKSFQFVLACAVGASLSLSAVASAQTVGDARRHYMEAEFEEAIEDFEAVLSRPSLDAAAAVECHTHLMTLRLLLGNADAARVHAAYALSLDPAASAPAGAPPEATQLLTDVRAELGGAARLTIDTMVAPEQGQPATILASLTPTPDGLFSSLRLRCASGDATADESGAPPSVELTLSPEDEIFCRATASTDTGAVLLRVRQTFALDEMPGDNDEGTSPWVWVGVGAGVLVVVATVVAVVLLVPSDQATLGPPTIESL